MHTQTLHGVDVTIAQPVKTVRDVKRTWKERLFTLPFTPLTKYKEVVEWNEILLDGQILQSECGLFMNSKTWKDVCDSVDNKLQ